MENYIVTCTFTIDNVADNVWVDGINKNVDVSSSATFNSWNHVATLTFDDTVEVLAIDKYDWGQGCINYGLIYS